MALYGIQNTSSLEFLTFIEHTGSVEEIVVPEGYSLYSGSVPTSSDVGVQIYDPLTIPYTGSFTGSYTGSYFGTASLSGSFTGSFYGLVVGSGSFTGSLTGSLTGSISGSDTISFSTTANQTVRAGEMAWDDGNGTLDIGLKGGNINLAVGQQTFARVYNAEATTLTKGTVVYISGSQGNRVAVKRADYSAELGSSNTLGFVAETITNGTEGFIITNGVLEKLNTTGLLEGELLFLSSSGQYTQTKPTAPKQLVVLGYVERVHATVGSIYVKIDNGYELDELHNVLTPSPSNGDLLTYSSSLWVNKKQLSGSYGVTGSLDITGSLNINGTSYTAATSGTSGTAGTSGATGASGTSGTSGTAGTSGASGATGASGTSGTSGTGFSTISNTGNDRILTSDGSSTAAVAESNITFNGSLLNLSGSIQLSNPGEIRTPILVGPDEKMTTLTVTGNGVGGVVTFDLTNGPIFKLTLDGNVTQFTTSNDPPSGTAAGFTLIVIGDGTARAAAWNPKFIWPGGAPALPSTNGNASIFVFTTFDQGSTYLSLVAADNVAGGLG